MIEFYSYEELAQHLRLLSPAAAIGVEGFCGAGKTYLADRLGSMLPAVSLDTDNFVKIQDSTLYYPEIVDLERLAEALEEADSQGRRVVLAGICLRDIAQRLSRTLAPIIYVKEVARTGLWHGLFHLEDFETDGGARTLVNEPYLSDLLYHSRSRPHENADILFVRDEAVGGDEGNNLVAES
ncbi:MAG: hypothetical protein WC809_20920 [Sinimarinibacterium sp.]